MAHVGRLAVVASSRSGWPGRRCVAEERRGRRLVLVAARGRRRLPGDRPAACGRLSQVTRLPNHVAVLVDTSRSMEVRPPDGGPSRAERAASMLERAAPRLGRLQQRATRSTSTPSASVPPATVASLREPPARRHPHRRGAGRRARALRRSRSGRRRRRLRRHRHRTHRRRAAGRRHAHGHRSAWRARPHGGPGRKSLRDLSVAAVLADQFALRANTRQHRGGHPPDRACPTARSR